MKHLLKLSDWSGEEITAALDLADRLKYEKSTASLTACLTERLSG